MTKPILVADPNQEFGILIRQSLEESGRYDVSLASAGKEAIRLAHDYTFELAIVDLALPDIEGFALIRQLRELQPDLAIIAIPKEEAIDPSLARQARIDGVLSKPFYLPDLPDVVAQALSGRLGTGPLGPRTPPSGERMPKEPGASVAPPSVAGHPSASLADPGSAADYLAQLTEETSADGALLIREGRLWASGGQLPVNQLQDLTLQVAESWADEARRGAIARFIRLPGMAIDHMLYATEVTPEFTLALVYKAETPFGKIRQQAQDLARSLADVDSVSPTETVPSQTPEPASEHAIPVEEVPEPASLEPDLPVEDPALIADDEAAVLELPTDLTTEMGDARRPSAAPFEDSEALETSSPEALPTDWIPEQESAASDRHLISQLAAVEPAAGEPDRQTFPLHEPIFPRAAQVDLPLDWLPMITQSRRHMPYLEEPAPARTGSADDRAQENRSAPPPQAAVAVPADENRPARPPQEPKPTAAAQAPPTGPPQGQRDEAASVRGGVPAGPTSGATAAAPSAPKPVAHAETERPSKPSETVDPAQQDDSLTAAPTGDRPNRHLPDDRLGYCLVLVPRFPEHRLSGAMTTHLAEWVRHLCIAWDWRADSVQVRDTVLAVHLTLPADTAPAAAADKLAEGLSSRVLEMYPHLGAGVPSGRFWASQYLLQAEPGPTAELIDSFIEDLRRAQGLRP